MLEMRRTDGEQRTNQSPNGPARSGPDLRGMRVSSRTHLSDPEPEDPECAGCGETISTGLYRRSMGVYACESCHNSAVRAYMESLE